MAFWRPLAAVASALAATAVPAHAELYEFVLEGNSAHLVQLGPTAFSTILEGVPTAVRGAGDIAAALQTTAGGTVVHTLTLDDMTFAGLPLADRVLRHTVDAAGNAMLCMAGTCLALGSAMPASWWNAPAPLELTVAPGNVTQTARSLALEPGGHGTLGATTVDVPAGGGSVDYNWVAASSTAPFGPVPLRLTIAPVPEPGTLALLAAGLAAAGVARRRKPGAPDT